MVVALLLEGAAAAAVEAEVMSIRSNSPRAKLVSNAPTGRRCWRECWWTAAPSKQPRWK